MFAIALRPVGGTKQQRAVRHMHELDKEVIVRIGALDEYTVQ